MKFVYLLQHAYQYGKNAEHEESKILGIYDTEEKAKEAAAHYQQLPGFRDFSDECFTIDQYELNKGEWSEGFVALPELH